MQGKSLRACHKYVCTRVAPKPAIASMLQDIKHDRVLILSEFGAKPLVFRTGAKPAAETLKVQQKRPVFRNLLMCIRNSSV